MMIDLESDYFKGRFCKLEITEKKKPISKRILKKCKIEVM